MSDRDNQQETTETERAWLAGIIEGDGSIGVGFHTYQGARHKRFAIKPMIQFSNQDGYLVERVITLLSAISGKNPMVRETDGRYENSNSTMNVSLCGMRAVYDVLEAIIPYLFGDKAPRARMIKKLIKSRLDRHQGRGIGASKAHYNEEELLLIEKIYNSNRRKGGKRQKHPEISGILRDYTRAVRQQKSA